MRALGLALVQALFAFGFGCGDGGSGSSGAPKEPERERDGLVMLRIELNQFTEKVTAQKRGFDQPLLTLLDVSRLDPPTPTREPILVPFFSVGTWTFDATTRTGGCTFFGVDVLEEDADEQDVWVLEMCSGP
jgi:hypothetical protein